MGGEKLKIFFCFVLLRKLKYTNDLQPNGDAGSSQVTQESASVK